MKQRVLHPDAAAARAAMTGPGDAMAPRADEAALLELCGDDFLDAALLAAQAEMPVDEARSVLLRAAARGTLERRGTTFRRAQR